MTVTTPVQIGIGIILLGPERLTRRFPALAKWAFAAIALCAYGLPVFYALPKNPADVFAFPPEYVRFMEDHRGLHRVQVIYPWDRWDEVNIPLQSGVLFGTRSADGFITVTLDRYTRFLNALIPGTFREEGGKIADLEAAKVFKEGAFLSDQNIPWLNFLGIRYLVAEERNLKFADHFFLAYPDSPLLASGNGAWVERRDELIHVLGPPLEDGSIPVYRRWLAMPEDLLRFQGSASGAVSIQKGDLLTIPVWIGPGRGWWDTVMTKNQAGASLKLEMVKYVDSGSGPPSVNLGLDGDRIVVLSFAVIPLKGDTVAGLIVNPEIENPGKYFKRVLAGRGFNIFENPGAMPAAFLAQQVERLPRQEALSRIVDPGFNPAATAVVEGPWPAGLRGGPLLSGEGVMVDKYSSERVELRAAAALPRLLLITDAYFPGWRARVDAREERILPADFAFRSIILEPGRHRVRMSYEPISFRLGLWSSLSGLAFLFMLAILRAARGSLRARRGL